MTYVSMVRSGPGPEVTGNTQNTGSSTEVIKFAATGHKPSTTTANYKAPTVPSFNFSLAGFKEALKAAATSMAPGHATQGVSALPTTAAPSLSTAATTAALAVS